MRVAGKGHGLGAPLRFSFDGIEYGGFEGDTLASALLANDVRLVGRSFKYHRPRGILTAGSEEPNALVTVGDNPNTRATQLELTTGLEAKSQNRGLSLRYDPMAINDLMSPFLGAGFYYKTFMWPRRFWEGLYEPIIRRAAGLGALSGKHNADDYEKAWAFCDVLVIGAGPAGLMAAYAAAMSGADVILADEDSRMGGRLLSEVEEIDGMPAATWASKMVGRLKAMVNVRLMTRTTVTGAYDQGTYGALERVTGTDEAPRECFWRIVAKSSVLAAGSLERPIAFPNNDRPGIMMAGAVRSYLNRWGVAPGQRVTVFANNDDAHRTARDLVEAGVDVVAIIDPRDDAPKGPIEVIQGYVKATKGRHGLREVLVKTPGGLRRLETDCLAMSGGWNPTVHLTCHMNGRPEWREDILSFVPKDGAIPGMQVAGAARGLFDTAACLQDGITAAKTALKSLGLKTKPVKTPNAEATPYNIEPLWAVEGEGRKWLDFQNDVHVKDIRLAVQENLKSVEHMKRYTTQGMATDQGKSSNVAALAVLADATGQGIPQTGTTTFRPPYVPVSIAAMGAGSQGHGFAPERHTTSHAATIARNAPMIEAGLWYRPSYFPAPHETTWREACDREVQMVRNSVGVCDVSTLGKIDVQGPDAAAFLDFVYANTFSTLKVGKVRYGIMLREDGHVMDDGTCARISDTQFVMTTTTAAAGLVMRHLDFVAQVLRPDLDVQVVSVTESWAQFSVAGPMARDLLNTILDTPTTDADLPYMSHTEISIAGTKGRLFRISFSGEQAYEIAVPADYGDSLYRILCAQAEVMGGGPYGMEALNVLRIEKGFITHAEIDGRVTAFDIGMDRMISRKKDCIGQAAADREGLIDPNRPQLIGLRPIDPTQDITAGAHLFEQDAKATRLNSQGYVTSVGYSPTCGMMLGMGFLARGRDRMGEVVRLVDHMRGIEVLCTVSDLVAYDTQGGRLRG